MTSETLQGIRATLLLVGAIIGVGMFGIPFVFVKAGILAGLGLLFLLMLLTVLFHLMYGEIVLRTNATHRLPGYVALYLGNGAGKAALLTNSVGMVGTLLAYLLLGGTFLAGLFGLELFWGYALFIFAGALFLLFDIRHEAVVGSVLGTLLVGTILAFLAGVLPSVSRESFILFSAEHALLPYGVLLFALSGNLIIPDLAEIAGGRVLKRAIIAGTIIPGVLYGLFALGVIGASGAGTSEDALSGLVPFLGRDMIALGQIVGLLAVFTSFISTGMVLKGTLTHDLGISKKISWALPIALPVACAAILTAGFIEVIGFVGGVTLGLDMIFTAMVFDRARRAPGRIPDYILGIPRVAVFAVMALMLFGVVYEAIYFFIW